MNFYKRFPGDYLRDTAHLSLMEHGVYSLMLDYFFSTEIPLKSGRNLYKMLRCENVEEKRAVDRVVKQYWVQTEDGLVNLRAVQEIEKADEIRKRNQENGSRGGRPRLKKHKPRRNPKKSDWVPTGLFLGFENKSLQTPDTRL